MATRQPGFLNLEANFLLEGSQPDDDSNFRNISKQNNTEANSLLFFVNYTNFPPSIQSNIYSTENMFFSEITEKNNNPYTYKKQVQSHHIALDLPDFCVHP